MAKKEIDKRIKEYVTKKGETKYMFRAYIGTDPINGTSRKTTRRGFDTPLAAERALKRLEVEIQTDGLKAVEKKTKKRFEEVYKAWFENYKRTVKESTWASTQIIFNKHILPILGKNFIDKMDVLYCQKIVNQWAEESPKQFKKYKNYASNVLDYAVSIGMLTSNSFKIVTIPKGELLRKEEKEIQFYTKQELFEFLDAAKCHDQMYYTFFYLLAFTGLRKGEALALNWSDINFREHTLSVDKTVTRGENSRLIINKPKTKAGKRKLLIDDGLVQVLKKYRLSKTKVVSISNDLIFHRDGSLYSPTLTKTWLLSIYRANPELKRISAHGFRHTHASLMFESGAELKDVQERLGHADIQTTGNIYTHVTESQNKKVLTNFMQFMNQK